MGLYAAWVLGANNSSGCVGAVAGCGMLSRRHALIIFTVFLALGVAVEGWKNMSTVGEGLVGGFEGQIAGFSLFALISMISAVVAVTSATLIGMPVSVSQAVVGAVMGFGIVVILACPGTGIWINTGLFIAVLVSWCLSPLLSAAGAFLVRKATVSATLRIASISGISHFMLVGLVLSSALTAYVFGANDLGASTGLFYPFLSGEGWPSAFLLAGVLGWAGAVFGALTYSTKVMRTVGSRITRLDAFTAFSAQLSTVVVVWSFVQMRIPVSTTQAFVGGLIGASLSRGVSTVNLGSMRRIIAVWILVPAASMALASILGLFTLGLM